ncbi:MAG TPA: signal peptidase I [Actinomycetota bacterium]
MRSVLRLTRAVATLAVAGLVLLLASAFVPTLFGYESMIVTSGSMGSAAPKGSVVLTRMVDARSIGTGDVISWRYPGRDATITHRVTSVERDGSQVVLRTKGDANATPDYEPVRLSSAVARVERVVPLAGHVVRVARSPVGGVVLFVLPIIGLALDGKKRRRTRALPPDSSPGPVPALQAALWKGSSGSGGVVVPWVAPPRAGPVR